ncbi:MAG: carboxypeptidase regulatory-like domain-containing protein [Bacteroidota bacterium]
MRSSSTIFSLLFVLFFAHAATAQSHKLSGQVIDDSGEVLIGATILARNAKLRSMTDVNGHFSLILPKSTDTLEIHYTGYESLIQPVDVKDGPFTFRMMVGAVLSEMVVIEKAKPLKNLLRKRKKRRHLATAEDAAMAPPEVMELESVAMAYDGGSAFETNIQAGTLTAGEINDFSKWELWHDIAEEDLAEYQEGWGIKPLDRYAFQLMSTDGLPIVDARVFLQSGKKVIWEARTDNTGKAELWNKVFANKNSAARREQLFIRVAYAAQEYRLSEVLPFDKGLNLLEIPANYEVPEVVDVAFVVDATSSMLDEIRYLKTELKDVIQKVKDSIPDLSLRLSSVFYRDHSDAYLTRHSDFSSDVQKTIRFIKQNNAQGGGDIPEAVDAALNVAVNKLSWSNQARSRMLFLVLDAPPHQQDSVLRSLQQTIQLAASKGIRIIPLACSGIDKSTEYLMRSMALLTNGTYTFLTDDSGIGNPHLEPTTDQYEVEKLNDLFQRLFFQFTYAPKCDEQARELKTIASLQKPSMLWEKKKIVQPTIPSKETPDPTAQWKYYPNPCQGILTIEINQNIDWLYVSDLSGKILQRIKWLGSKKQRLELGQLPSGLYLLTYEQEGRWVSGKLFLQRKGTLARL